MLVLGSHPVPIHFQGINFEALYRKLNLPLHAPFNTKENTLSQRWSAEMCVGTYWLRHSWGSLFPSAAAELQGTTIKKKKKRFF